MKSTLNIIVYRVFGQKGILVTVKFFVRCQRNRKYKTCKNYVERIKSHTFVCINNIILYVYNYMCTNIILISRNSTFFAPAQKEKISLS